MITKPMGTQSGGLNEMSPIILGIWILGIPAGNTDIGKLRRCDLVGEVCHSGEGELGSLKTLTISSLFSLLPT